MGKQNASSHRHISDRWNQNNLFHFTSSFTLNLPSLIFFSFFYCLLKRTSYFPDLSYLIKPVKVIQARLRLSVSRHLSLGSPGHSGVYIALSPPLSAAIMSLHPLTPGTMVTIHPDFMAERFTPLS